MHTYHDLNLDTCLPMHKLACCSPNTWLLKLFHLLRQAMVKGREMGSAWVLEEALDYCNSNPNNNFHHRGHNLHPLQSSYSRKCNLRDPDMYHGWELAQGLAEMADLVEEMVQRAGSLPIQLIVCWKSHAEKPLALAF